jgi:hypothetical protein
MVLDAPRRARCRRPARLAQHRQAVVDEAGDRTVAALRGAAARAHALRAADLTGRGRVARALDLPGLQEASRVWTAPAAGLATAAIGAGRLNPAWASAARGALWPTASIAASWRLDKYLTMPRPGAPLFASLSASNTLTKALMANAVKSTLAGPVGFTGAAPPRLHPQHPARPAAVVGPARRSLPSLATARYCRLRAQ